MPKKDPATGLLVGPPLRKPKLLAYVDHGKCFGRGCEMFIAVCPVLDCITLVPDPEAGAVGEVCEVNTETCIGCQKCAEFCPADYDAVHMFPYDEGMRLARERDRTFEYREYHKKPGAALAPPDKVRIVTKRPARPRRRPARRPAPRPARTRPAQSG